MAKKDGAVQRELQQRVPFRTPGAEAAVGIMRTASLLQRAISQVVEPHGITRQQYNVLRILRGSGAQGLPTLTIRDRMIEEAPGITRLIDRLEQAGLISRERCSPDRRQVLCRINERGLALLDALEEQVDGAVDRAVSLLDEREQRQLIALLDRVRAAVQH